MSNPASARRKRADNGFTLVELIVVVVVTAIIATGMSNAIVVILRNNVSIATRLDNNRDLLSLATWLPQDVNSSSTTNVQLWTAASVSPCSTSTTGTVGQLLLGWVERIGTTNSTYSVMYRTKTTGSAAVLQRWSCTNGLEAKIMNVSKALPLLSGNVLPFNFTVTAGHVVLTITQNPGTASQQQVKVEADAKNPATTAVLPAYVADARTSRIVSVTPATPAATEWVDVALQGFGKSEPIEVYIEDYRIGEDLALMAALTADITGAATAHFQVPTDMSKSTRRIFAFGNQAGSEKGYAEIFVSFQSATLTVSYGGSATGVKPGANITLTLADFEENDPISFTFDGDAFAAPAFTFKAASSTTLTVSIPANQIGGSHTLTAIGGLHGRPASAEVNVTPGLTVPAEVTESFPATATLIGFFPSERVRYQLAYPDGVTKVDLTDPNETSTTYLASTTGADARSLTIPFGTPAGTYTIWANGVSTGYAHTAASSLLVKQASRDFAVTMSNVVVTAGQNATMTLTARKQISLDPAVPFGTDTTFTGPADISVTGATGNAGFTQPSTTTISATFVDGVATITYGLVKAAPTTLAVSSTTGGFTRTGNSPSITVKASAISSLIFTSACAGNIGPGGQSWTTGLIPRDTFGNAVASAGVHVTFSPKINNGQTAVKTIDMTTWTEKTPNQSYSVTTGADGITAYFTMSGAAASNKSAVVVTATATQSPSSSTVLATASPCTLT